MKKLYSMGLLLLVLVLAASLLVACGTKEETTTTAAATETTAAATETTAAAATGEKVLVMGAVGTELGLYAEDQGNNVLKVTDVPAPGLQFPISTSGDFAMTIEILGDDGSVLGTVTTDTGLVDYSQYAAAGAKIRITTIDGTVYVGTLPGK
jgi:hypothetical protein